MDTMLILRHVRVENANAVSGLTWGFPAITGFLGFVHALSRKLPVDLQGCGVICHNHEVLAHRPHTWGDHVFALTRNPITKEGKTASFVEEGRMHMTVSLVIPVEGDVDDLEEHVDLCTLVEEIVLSHRLAGGTVQSIGAVELHEAPEDYEGLRKFERRQLGKLLPGFALVQRFDLLADHVQGMQSENPGAEPLDAWLDFSALKYEASTDQVEGEHEEPVEWRRVPKPAGGWLVPIAVGFRGISKVYEPGEVARTRDPTVPFRFVEAVYSIGEWISPHRLSSLDDLVWRYEAKADAGWYLCRNNYNSNNTVAL